MIRAAGVLDCSSADIRLREPDKSEDKADSTMVSQRRDFVESLIPCSHGGRALVVKGAEKAKNVEANSKFQARLKGRGQRTL
ncbi:hypothetical protein B296_00022010 [Ensete ventricosum]|uniref:Uncharacterized protein n=1 Tax=Ensete ventricosum TaxID=4639 RepID=A0A426YP09_ENSVE|nr:hypothetical protein B296_00022010 [Ensete ventricosum]